MCIVRGVGQRTVSQIRTGIQGSPSQVRWYTVAILCDTVTILFLWLCMNDSLVSNIGGVTEGVSR